MVNRKISADLKECALSLWNNGWELEDVVNALAVSRSSIYRWKAIFAEHGSVNRPPSGLRGRARIITSAVLTAIHTLYESDSDLYLDELVFWLAIHHDIVISVTALHETLKKAGLTRKLLHKIAIERDQELWRQWKEMQASDDFLPDGSQWVALDETSKNELSFARRYGRSYSGERAELVDVFARGDRFSLVGALAVEGFIAGDAVAGSFDSVQFLEFVQEKVLPQMNPFPAARSILLLDNCRIHHNEALVELVQAAGCLILYLPAYSPDLNPIEEAFSALKAYLRRYGHAIRQDLDPIASLLEACGCITADMSKGWFKHAGYIH